MMPFGDVFLVLTAPFIGSFVTTLAHRLPAGVPIVIARSACPACGTTLSPMSLVPVVSWIVQQGRCRHCQTAISPAYPLVEITALLVALWAMTVVSGWLFIASCILGWALLALALIDARNFILPDVLTLPLLAGGLVTTFAIDQGRLLDHLLAAVIAFGALSAIGVIYRMVRGRDGLGLGDAKLLAAGGAWVGLAGLPGIVLIACFSALTWALVQSVIQQKLSSDLRIAFGPFLALGIWAVWLYGPLEIQWAL